MSSHPLALLARLATLHRALAVVVLGFASGLPLALSGQALQAWLTMDGLDMATIGFLSLAGLPYTFKFLWAPLMDRIDLPGRQRRRGWLVLTQLLLAGALWAMAATSPHDALPRLAALAVLVAFLSASQDVVIDAWRTDVLPPRERGLGASLAVMGYRLAMIVSGGVVLIWTDPVQGGGLTWPQVYRILAGVMAACALGSALLLPRLPALSPAQEAARRASPVRQDLQGFLAVLLAVALGVALTRRFGTDVAGWLLQPLFGPVVTKGTLAAKWVDLGALLLGLGLTLPLAAWAARLARFRTLLDGLQQFFARPQAGHTLGFIVFYKLTDAFALALLTPFLIKGMGFSPAEVGVANKLVALALTLLGALLGGLIMLRLRLARALLVFGVLQMVSNLGFWWLSVHGKGAMGSVVVPAFDIGLLRLALPTPVDGGLLMAVAAENIASGMGTTAILAFLMSLTHQRYTATQFALLSAFVSIGRVWVGPLAGVLTEAIGWPAFFLVAVAMGLPSLVWLRVLWPGIEAREAAAAAEAGAADAAEAAEAASGQPGAAPAR